MTLRSYAETAAVAALVVLVAALAVGQLLGQPILLGYVATGSMEPAMSAGDGFVAVPSALAGDVDEGDVVVFEAEELHGGGLTTHRVVDETERGYVTKGDANPFTDQDGGEPPVTEGQIVAHALQIDGNVVVVPHLGTAVMAVQSVGSAAQDSLGGLVGADGDRGAVGALFVGVGALFLALAALSGARSPGVRDLRRSTSRRGVVAAWSVAGGATLLVIALATAAMVVPAGVHEYGAVSAEEPSADPLVIEPGETGDVQYRVHNDGLVPVVAFLEPGDGAAASPDRLYLGRGDAAETTVTLDAPDRTGRFTRHVTEHRYLFVLPPSVVASLHAVHPLLALVVIDVVVATVILGLSVALLGTSNLRFRSPGDHVSLGIRLRRKLRKWF